MRLHTLQNHYETQLQAIAQERDRLMAERDRLAAERDDLKAKLDVEREARHTAAAHLRQRVNDLTAKEAELRGELKQYTVGGRRLPAMVLVAAAALVVVLTMLVLFLLLR